MIFKKEFLQGLYEGDKVVISDEVVDTSRWSVIHERIFKHEEKFYKTVYSQGATECQDESPYENDGDKIECPEVVQVEKKVIVYEEIKVSTSR